MQEKNKNKKTVSEVKCTHKGYTLFDPMRLILGSGQFHRQHKICGVTSRWQRTWSEEKYQGLQEENGIKPPIMQM